MSFKTKIARLICSLNNHGFLNPMSDAANIRLVYWAQLGKKVNLKRPVTFNEKIQWLKLNDRRPEYCTMVDKYSVRTYIEEKLGAEYLIPLYGVWERAEDIDFDNLPNTFVLKCTHDTGSILICRNKDSLDRNEVIAYFKKHLKRNSFYYGREWPYKDVTPRIIAEKYMIDEECADLRDYKIHCFNGEPRVILVCSERHKSGLKEDWFTPEWEHLPIHRPTHGNSKNAIEKPELFDKMLDNARLLADGIPFSRIDFYLVNHHLYFGEITLYPTSGYTPFVPDEYDRILGGWLHVNIGNCKSRCGSAR